MVMSGIFSANCANYSNILFVVVSQCHVPSVDSGLTSENIQNFFGILSSSVDIIKTWAEKVPGFSDLCREDQQLLLNSAMLELISLRLAFR